MGHKIELSYLQKQNSWQSQWLHFATTNKRCTSFLVWSYNYQPTAK